MQPSIVNLKKLIDNIKISLPLSKADILFIEKLLKFISYDKRHIVMKTYIDVWHKAMAECIRPIAAMNVGRRAANTYLRDLIDERNS